MKLVVITRKDLTPGQQIAQTNHATAELAVKDFESFKQWNTESNSIITLQTKTEEELENLKRFLAGKVFAEFREPDLGDALTAISFIADRQLRKKFSSLPLASKGASHG